jgi:hypothetical protein
MHYTDGASVHPVPSMSLSRWRSADITALTHYTDGVSVHPVLKTPQPKRLWKLPRDRRIDRRFPLTKASIYPVLKTSSWRVSVLIQTERQIDRRCPHSDCWIIRCYCLHCSSSAIHPTHIEYRPSDHLVLLSSLLFVWLAAQCTNYTDAMHRWYRRFIRRCQFPSFSSAVLTLEK